MSQACGKCGLTFTELKSLIACTGKCYRLYHVDCTELKIFSDKCYLLKSLRPTWVCEFCDPLSKHNKSYAAFDLDFQRLIDRVGKLNVRVDKLSKLNISLLEKPVLDKRRDYEQVNSDTTVSDNDLIQLFEKLKSDFDALHITNEMLLKENKQMRTHISKLQDKLFELEYYTRSANIEIAEFLESLNENTLRIFREMLESTKQFDEMLLSRKSVSQAQIDEWKHKARLLDFSTAQVNKNHSFKSA